MAGSELGPSLIRKMLSELGENPDREGLSETAERSWRAWNFFFSGYDQDPSKILKVFKDGAEKIDELVFVGSIATYSFCEHHLLPFFGVTHVGYIPNGKVVGLSKIARVVEIFSRRLQTQENITQQVAEALDVHLKPIGVGVVLQCRHLCMEARGVQKPGTITMTSAVRGALKAKPEARAEFFSMVHGAKGNLL